MAMGKFHGVIKPDHAHRLAGDFHADAGAHRGQRLARQTQAFAGEELEDVAGAGGFADAFGAGLAFFAGQQGAEFFAARQDFGADLVQRVGAGLNAGDRPGREGGAGGLHRRLHLLGAGLGVVAQHVGQVGGVDVGAVAGAGYPGAVDEVVKFLCHAVFLRRGSGSRCTCGPAERLDPHLSSAARPVLDHAPIVRPCRLEVGQRRAHRAGGVTHQRGAGLDDAHAVAGHRLRIAR